MAFVQKYPNLFSPCVIRGIRLKNRILSAPLGVWALCPADGLPDYTLRFFEERAAGGAATVVMGDTQVNAGAPECDDFGFVLPLRGSAVPMALLAQFADACAQHGALASVELCHGGEFVHLPPGQCAYGVSDHQGPFGPVRAMTREKIAEVEQQFAECASTLKRAGFRMLTIHGGHGKLFDQFLSRSNKRPDEYGGCLENRMRFCVEILEQVRAAVGEEFIIELRVSARDPETEPEEFEELITFLNRLEGIVDIVNVSVNHPPFEPFRDERDLSNQPSYLEKPAPNARLAGEVKKRIRIPVSAVGAIIGPEYAEEILASGTADFVALGRPLMADPELPNKARQGREAEIRPCIGCMKCLDHMHRTHVIRCSVNPRLGREAAIPQSGTAARRKRVAVVGGGLAGIQTAITAAERGHDVTLFEKSGRLGGIIASFAQDELKYRLNLLLRYLCLRLERSGAAVQLNTQADAALLASLEPDAILLAAGSEPIVPAIPGAGGANVSDVLEAHQNMDRLGKRIVIVGGNLSGCELAISLHRSGRQVTVVEMGEALHPGSDNARLDQLLRGVRIELGAQCREIRDSGVIVRRGTEEVFLPGDSVVLAVGMKSRRGLADALRFLAPEYAEIGDCARVGTVAEALRSAYFAALDL